MGKIGLTSRKYSLLAQSSTKWWKKNPHSYCGTWCLLLTINVLCCSICNLNSIRPQTVWWFCLTPWIYALHCWHSGSKQWRQAWPRYGWHEYTCWVDSLSFILGCISKPPPPLVLETSFKIYNHKLDKWHVVTRTNYARWLKTLNKCNWPKMMHLCRQMMTC